MTDTPLIRPIFENAVRVTHFDPRQGSPVDRPWFKDVVNPEGKSGSSCHKITVKADHGLCQAFTPQGECFFQETSVPVLHIAKRKPYFYADIPQTTFVGGIRRVDDGISMRLDVQPEESFYGWGEWFNGFERKSGQIALDNRNALFGEQTRLTYSGLPFFISSRGYGFLLLNGHRSCWKITPQGMTIEADGPAADYILIYGPGYKEILHTYTNLTGRPPLPPRWGFGLWVTGYPQENQAAVIDFIDRHRARKIPLDAVILDYHWEERFHNFKFRSSLFPDPPALAKALQTRGARLGLILTSYLNTRNRPVQKWLLNTFGQNVTPGLEKDDERALQEFAEAQKNGYLAHEHVHWWFGTGGMLDFTNPGASAWWQSKLQSLFQAGAAFIKNDDGEDLPDDARASNGMDGREYHNLYGFYYGKATYERPAPQGENLAPQAEKRTMIYARTAWVGSQRFPALFLGDQQADFESIRRGMRAGLNLAMAGFSYWTADVFGLAGKTSPQIHQRYAQWALLNPVARYFIRPAGIDNTRYPWSHGEAVEANFRTYTELRMRLLPYYNSLAHESHLTGIPIMRPLLMEFENDKRLRGIDDQVMLGSMMMICPVVQPGATSRKIVLPQGTWHDYWSSQTWEGGGLIEYQAPFNRLPILIRGGCILTLGPVLQYIPDNHVFDDLELNIWPPFPSEGMFFDDDGQTCAYRAGGFSRTRIRAERTGSTLQVLISKAQGNFDGQAQVRKITLVIHTPEHARAARLNSASMPVETRDQKTILTFEHRVHHDSYVEISFQD